MTCRGFHGIPREEASEEAWLTSFHDHVDWSFMGQFLHEKVMLQKVLKETKNAESNIPGNAPDLKLCMISSTVKFPILYLSSI